MKGLYKMNVEQIFKLVDAGFTKADIMALIGENQPTEAPKQPEDVNSQPAAETPSEAPAEPQHNINDEIAATLASMNNTLAKLQTFALKTDTQPGRSDNNDYKTILSSLYNKKE
jgi:hypothetical protein